MTWTGLATRMTTVRACLVTAEERVATVTGAAYPHPDRLFDPVAGRYTGIMPVARLEFHTILLE